MKYYLYKPPPDLKSSVYLFGDKSLALPGTIFIEEIEALDEKQAIKKWLKNPKRIGINIVDFFRLSFGSKGVQKPGWLISLARA
jgi:hypothetical protein